MKRGVEQAVRRQVKYGVLGVGFWKMQAGVRERPRGEESGETSLLGHFLRSMNCCWSARAAAPKRGWEPLRAWKGLRCCVASSLII